MFLYKSKGSAISTAVPTADIIIRSSLMSQNSLYPTIELQFNDTACCFISSLTEVHHKSISASVVFDDISLTDLADTNDTYLVEE